MRRFSAPFSAFFSLFCTKALFPAPFIEVHEHGSELYAEILIAFHIRTLPQMGNAYLGQIHCPAVLLSLSCQVCILAVKEVSLVKAAYTFKYVSPYADKAARAEAAAARGGRAKPPLSRGAAPRARHLAGDRRCVHPRARNGASAPPWRGRRENSGRGALPRLCGGARGGL